MKTPCKILSLLAGVGLLAATNTSCTPTEAAIVGGVAGAAIGAAMADDHHHYHRHGPPRHRGQCGRPRGTRGYYYY